MPEITVPFNFIPRWYQLPLLNCLEDGFKRAIAVWHRRAGKDKVLLNMVVKEAHKRIGAYYYFLPTYAQGRKILWDGMDYEGFRFMNHIPTELRQSTNNTEMKIVLKSGSLIQVIGSDNIDAVMGTNPIGCVFSEFALQDPRGYDYVRPILAENNGWAVFNGTPRGMNHFYDLFVMAKNNPKWFCETLTVNDTKVITDEEIEEERKSGMDEDLILQEFYVSFESAYPGAYYGSQMRKARDDKRITKVPWQDGIAVDTWWDLGIDDSTTIWLTQDVGREIHVIDYYENSGEALSHYVKWLEDWGKNGKRAVFGRNVLPHDAGARSLQTGETLQQQARKLGLKAEVSRKVSSKESAIEATRRILNICWFDEEKCSRGINCLTNYRKEYDEKNKTWRSRPVHDWASHGSDAFSTLAMAHDFRNSAKSDIKNSKRPHAKGWT